MHILWKENLQQLKLNHLGREAMELVMDALKSQKASVDACAATDATISLSDEIEPARKRRASTEVGIRNSWGIRNMDSILGNSHLAVKWSLRSITATDRKNVTDDGFLETTRTAGSQALAALHVVDIREVKLNARKHKVKDLEEQFSRLEENLQNAEIEAYGACKKNKELEAKLVMVVPTFLRSTTYKGCLHAFAQSRVPETFTAYFTHIVGEIERGAPYFNTSVLKNAFATAPTMTLCNILNFEAVFFSMILLEY
ncbi:hypothetical protein OROMI_006304 [Orobanche minor]